MSWRERSANGFGTWETSSTRNGGTIDKVYRRCGPGLLDPRVTATAANRAEHWAARWTLLNAADKTLLEIVRGKAVSHRGGLHHGSVTCGNVGLVAQRDATILGDTVNTVFRIESLMKQLNQRLALSQDFLTDACPSQASI